MRLAQGPLSLSLDRKPRGHLGVAPGFRIVYGAFACFSSVPRAFP